MPNTIITKCGEIRGTTCQWDGVVAYKGIRYATAGRWEYPQIVTHWDGVYEADKYGNCSYQPRAFYNEEEVIEKIGTLLKKGDTILVKASHGMGFDKIVEHLQNI